ncbi:MAG: pseudouridine synthase [Pseudomonadota bacterium]|jgi:23S rRNA pseudouridine2604 synthase
MKKPAGRNSSAGRGGDSGRSGPPARPSNRNKTAAPAKPAAPGRGRPGSAAGKATTPAAAKPDRNRAAMRSAPAAPSAGTARPRRSKVTGTNTLDMLDPFEPQRLSKIMAAKGLCSRREADYLIENGWVRVNGKVVDELGAKVLPTVTIDLDARAKNVLGKQVTILYHKPIGVVSGQPEGRYKAAMECLSLENQADRKTSTPFQPAMLKGLAPAGRLDIDSTGLLVLTQDGRIAKQLIDANSTVEKEYLVRVEGELTDRGLEMLRYGLSLDGEALKPARVSWQNEDQLRFILNEGKKRQIRRMCEIVGLKVVGLKRVRIGRVMLGDLPVGQWRLLTPEERF